MVAEHGHPRISERIVKHIVLVIDELFPLVMEEILEVAKSISHERIQ